MQNALDAPRSNRPPGTTGTSRNQIVLVLVVLMLMIGSLFLVTRPEVGLWPPIHSPPASSGTYNSVYAESIIFPSQRVAWLGIIPVDHEYVTWLILDQEHSAIVPISRRIDYGYAMMDLRNIERVVAGGTKPEELEKLQNEVAARQQTAPPLTTEQEEAIREAVQHFTK